MKLYESWKKISMFYNIPTILIALGNLNNLYEIFNVNISINRKKIVENYVNLIYRWSEVIIYEQKKKRLFQNF